MDSNKSAEFSTLVECSGALFHLVIASINQLNIFPPAILNEKTSSFNVDAWDQIAKLADILRALEQIAPISSNVYFHAGTQLASLVSKHKPTDKPFNAHVWLNENFRLHDNTKTIAYALQAHDTEGGHVLYNCATYLPLDYIKGYFYGCYNQSGFTCEEVTELHAQSEVISVRYASSPQANFSGVKAKLQADYQQEISHLLQDSLCKQIEASAMISRLNAELIEQRDKIARLANHDPVTGLASLRLGRDRLRMACNTAKRNNVKAAVMLIDLDGFKQANSHYGHVVGDVILKTVADRISQSIRATDSAVRQSGDSFLIILSMFNEPSSLAIVAKRVISAIVQPIIHESLTLHITCNIGIAIYPDDTDAAEQMIKCADKAIHTIKKSLTNQFAFYENLN